MSRGVTFGEKDQELIEKIEEYQHAKKLKSFVDAVRELCGRGLTVGCVIDNIKE